jgi:integrase
MSIPDDQPICPSSAHPKWKGSPRTSVNYWRHRVEQTTGRGGVTNPHLCARITYKGKRVRFGLETANKDAAASKAASIYRFIAEHGWEEALKKYRPDAVKPLENTVKTATVGEFIAAVEKLVAVRSQTIRAYVQAFRKIVAEVSSIPCTGKHTRVGDVVGGVWRSAVDAVPLSSITPTKVQEWKQRRLREHESNALQQRRDLVTVSSSIRNAKSLFRKDLIVHVSEGVELPAVLPFEGISPDRPKPARYQSRIDAATILKKAAKELSPQKPESYKILLLSLVCGLRASEIDHLLWDKFDFTNKILRIEDTEFHRLKSENSAGDLDLDAQTVEVFKAFSKKATSIFVIESEAPDTRSKTAAGGSYRCQRHFDAALKFLRTQGIKANKPIHELRKEVGSIIASAQGIYAASRYLRHGDIQITAAVYADKKERVTPKLKIPA